MPKKSDKIVLILMETGDFGWLTISKSVSADLRITEDIEALDTTDHSPVYVDIKF